MSCESRCTRSDQLKQSFELVEPLTVGLEEEVMLLEPETLELGSAATRILAPLSEDFRFAIELPASQVEIRTPPERTALEASTALGQGRIDLAAACGHQARPAVAGVHPFSSASGELNRSPRYDSLHDYYRWAAERQLVSSLQVHVAVGGADRTLAIYNTLRGYLPEIAALAANAPIHKGKDTGLASIRPLICSLLPRQGIPPTLSSWEQFAQELDWGIGGDGFRDRSAWWWELRPHVKYGTLEVRVPDAQTQLSDAAGVAAFVQALVATLVAEYDAGEPLPIAATWRIEENRWAALRFGIKGQFSCLASGRRVPIQERLLELIERIRPAAQPLGIDSLLPTASRLEAGGGAARQRDVFRSAGPLGLAGWLARSFLSDREGVTAG